jgi:hypothetical protein
VFFTFWRWLLNVPSESDLFPKNGKTTVTKLNMMVCAMQNLVMKMFIETCREAFHDYRLSIEPLTPDPKDMNAKPRVH